MAGDRLRRFRRSYLRSAWRSMYDLRTSRSAEKEVPQTTTRRQGAEEEASMRDTFSVEGFIVTGMVPLQISVKQQSLVELQLKAAGSRPKPLIMNEGE